MSNGIQVEAMGGEVPSVEVSGLTGQGLPDLVETLSTLAEMRSLHAEDKGPIHGYVLESKVLKGLGPVATVLVLRGSLKSGAHLISGLSHAKVRVMTDSSGKSTKLVPPGTAVTVSGWKTLPNAGDEVLEAEESDIKRALVNRERQADIDKSLVDVEVINNTRRKEREIREEEEEQQRKQKNHRQTIITAAEAEAVKEEEGPKELRLIIKGDVSGSVEAVAGALTGIGNHIAVTKIISSGVGDISESDVTMAKNCGAMLVGFSVNASRSMEQLAARNDVQIYTSPIIYRLMEEVKNRVISLLPVVIEKRVVGEASVLDLFTITLKGKKTKQVAGCRVTNGLVEKSKLARLVRNGEVMFEGTLDTMRHLKKDVTELRKGTECGLSLLDFDSVQVGDMIQMYEEVQSPGSL
jgi:translation initiation factor IF-2